MPRDKADSYGKPILIAGNGGFSAFAGVFDPGNVGTGPALFFFKSRRLFREEAPSVVCRFSRIAVLHCFGEILGSRVHLMS